MLPDTRPTPAKDSGINVARYVSERYTPYSGDGSFLAPASDKTRALWARLEKLCAEELSRGIMGVDPAVPSSITAFAPGYIDKQQEVVVGLQTDAPLKRAIKPLGACAGLRRRAAPVRACMRRSSAQAVNMR